MIFNGSHDKPFWLVFSCCFPGSALESLAQGCCFTWAVKVPTSSACIQHTNTTPHVCMPRRDGLAAILQKKRGLLYLSLSNGQGEAL